MEKITEEERLKLMLNHERRNRLQAEERMLNMRAQMLGAEQMSVDAEGAALGLALRSKYGLTEEDSIEPATGAVKRATPKPKLAAVPTDADVLPVPKESA